MRVRSTRETFKKSGVTGGTGVTEVCMYTHLISIFHTAKIQKKRGKSKEKREKSKKEPKRSHCALTVEKIHINSPKTCRFRDFFLFLQLKFKQR